MPRAVPFALDLPLGRGGMGEVWAAVHRDLKLPVAIKFLATGTKAKASFYQSFRNEVRAAAGLDHPNIVRIYDHGETTPEMAEATKGRVAPGSPWIAMELVRGSTLLPLAGRLRWPEIETVLASLLRALAHAHARGVVHRDLKPGNVLVTRAPGGGLDVKLTDFGLAQALDGEAAQDAPFAGGTPAYMAPEQFEGRWRDYGPWTDLYAFGALSWSLIRGSPPFGGETYEEKRRQHLEEAPPPLKAHTPLPSGLEAWLLTLLEKDPAKRFRRAADALAALTLLGPPDPTTPLDDGFVEPLAAMETVLVKGARGQDRDATTITMSQVPSSIGRTMPLGAALSGAAPTPLDWRTPDSRPAIGAQGLGMFGLRPLPLVGREPEQDLLWAKLCEVAASGRPQAVVLTGPGGAGKSHLAEWLCQRSQELGAANALRVSHGPVVAPSHGLAGMIRSLLRCQGLPREQVRDRVEGVLRHAGITHEDEWAALTELLAPAQSTNRGGVRFGSATERWITVRRVLQLACDERPAVLWLDEVQYGLEAIQFAQYVLSYRRRSGMPVLMVLTVSEDEAASRLDEATSLAELLEHERAATMRLGPLAPEHRGALVRGLLRLDDSLAKRVEDRTAGDPMFAVQLLSDWVGRGVLVASPSGYRFAPGADEPLPANMSVLFADRIRRMLERRSAAEAHALELAAVLGPDVEASEWVDACVRATPAADPSDALLDALLDQRLAAWGAGGPVQGFSFTHPAIRDAIEDRARRADRLVAWHRLCAEVLDDRGGSLSAGAHRSERIGRHRLGAGEPAAALPLLLAGVQERANAGEHGVAERLLDSCEPALDAMGAAGTDPRRAVVWELRIELAHRLGHWEEMDRVLAAAEAASAASSNPGAAAGGWGAAGLRIRAWRGRRERTLGHYFDALEHLTAVEQAAARLGDRQLVASSRKDIGETLLESGDVKGAERWLRLALVEAETLADPLSTAHAWRTLGDTLKEAGRHSEASELLRRAEERFSTLGNRYGMAVAANSRGDVARYQGDLDGAEALYRRARGLLRAIGSTAWTVPEYNGGLVFLARGDYDRAKPILERCLERFSSAGHQPALAHAHLALAACAAAEGLWLLWDDHLGEARSVLDETGNTDEDTARLAVTAARAAAAAAQPARGVVAAQIAVSLWRTLNRGPERIDAERLLAELGGGPHTTNTPSAAPPRDRAP